MNYSILNITMKHYNISSFVALLVLSTYTMLSCNDEWYDHYSSVDTPIHNADVEVSILNIEEYLKTEGSYIQMSQLFENNGIYNQMSELGLLYTTFVVADSNYLQPEEIDPSFLSQAHVTSSQLSPNSLNSGQRLQMWNKKYCDIESVNEDPEKISINDCLILKTIKTRNGYIYVIDRLIETPHTLIEVIENLDEKHYSIFKNEIFSRSELTFDKENSLPIGIDASGNTVYDSVFTIRNPYFEKAGINLYSESSKYTMLIPSDSLIRNALSEAKDKLKSWNYQREDSILEQWCFQSCFFKNEYDRAIFEDPQNIDLTSVFSKQWRTTVNKVDLERPIKMSNGTAYYVTSLKIPQNVLIYRVKRLAKWYQYMTSTDKETYFAANNYSYNTLRTDVSAWTPGEGWPEVSNIGIEFKINTAGMSGALTWKGFDFTLYEDNTYKIEDLYLPPGEYSVHLGFYVKNMKAAMDVYFNGRKIQSITPADVQKYSRDRSGGGYPEGYNLSTTTYDRDGRELCVMTVEGDEPVPVVFRFYTHEYSSTTQYCIAPEHFTIRPTANCY